MPLPRWHFVIVPLTFVDGTELRNGIFFIEAQEYNSSVTRRFRSSVNFSRFFISELRALGRARTRD